MIELFNRHSFLNQQNKQLAPVVQKLDSAVQRINHYTVNKY